MPTSSFRSNFTAFAVASALFTALTVSAGATTVKGSFVPGVSIVPNVFEPDGQTLRTYQTASGPTYWSPNLPVRPGDKLVLKVFATTGGADLTKLIVRLDNVKIAEPATAPWIATVDTSTLQQGSHMVEVWAEASGSPAKSTTKTFSFVVANPVAQAPVTTTTGSAVIAPDQPVGDAAPDSPMPKFLADQPVDADAGIAIRSDDADFDRMLTSDDGSISVSAPVLLYAERTPGSNAMRYAYSITRDGRVVISSKDAQSMQYVKIRLQPMADNNTGLLPGKITLWVWGIDKAGHPSNPTHRDFVISSTGQ
jgi:hypothetical protein